MSLMLAASLLAVSTVEPPSDSEETSPLLSVLGYSTSDSAKVPVVGTASPRRGADCLTPGSTGRLVGSV